MKFKQAIKENFVHMKQSLCVNMYIYMVNYKPLSVIKLKVTHIQIYITHLYDQSKCLLNLLLTIVQRQKKEREKQKINMFSVLKEASHYTTNAKNAILSLQMRNKREDGTAATIKMESILSMPYERYFF